ncbi:MAG: anhydro-N-acetylmuramic acid kinase [Chromatiales bacterium]|nr:anhydro-N-acetylmuramic acid kinase [Chromatiales bacterium]
MALYAGLISGTSMDGVDTALVAFDEGRVTTVATHSAAIPDALKRELHALAQDPSVAALRFWNADARLGSVFADAALGLLEIAGVDAREVTALGSHGQTVYHAPGAATPLTVQIGDPSMIAERTGITTVADFRRRDVAAGGEGAPLAPAFHRAVFSTPGVERGILNLGGIANLSVLPADPGGALLGFDTGPANTLLDAWVRERFGAGMDRDAELARRGKVIPPLLAALLAEPYFDRAPPKSTGRELFNPSWLAARLAAHSQAQPCDVLRTLCELTVETAVAAVERFAPRTREICLCGGGARNPLLVARLAERAAPIRVGTTERLGIHPDWVEAAAFAWLAMRTLAGKAGNAPTVTGAARETVLGGVYRA